MAYLLDTNAWIHYLKHAEGSIRRRLNQASPAEIVTCSVVRAELLHGARKYAESERRRNLVNETLAPFRSHPFDNMAAEHYAAIRHDLETQGQVIGPYDLQIAAICIANNCVLVTSNTKEFARVKYLTVDDWLAHNP